ncbi:MAG: DUF1080 domain-containing protein [Verrucomicrobiae bacterium]|nr:DUF1080 domain-containing protein [Verrucomicrobiae bacterium]
MKPIPLFSFIVRCAAFAGIALPVLNTGEAADKEKGEGPKAWVSVTDAVAEDPDFPLQGEYLGSAKGSGGIIGVQVSALGDGSFYVNRFAGGLPGAGWDEAKPEFAVVDRAGVADWTSGLQKQERKSPTLGAEPPSGAIVLFSGEANSHVKGEVKDGLLWAGAETTAEYGDFQLHVEFRLPYKPKAVLSSQDRGNSGIYLQNRYEVQVIDSFGVLFNSDWVGIPLKSDLKQLCGSFYKFKTPDAPMCLPPLTWQTYDIDFTAPKFEGDKKVANARISVVHNGIKIHDNVELPKGTGAGGSRPEVPRGPILFQGHGNPVAYRNVWLMEK